MTEQKKSGDDKGWLSNLWEDWPQLVLTEMSIRTHVNIPSKIFKKQGSLRLSAHLSLLSRDFHMQTCTFFTDPLVTLIGTDAGEVLKAEPGTC